MKSSLALVAEQSEVTILGVLCAASFEAGFSG